MSSVRLSEMPSKVRLPGTIDELAALVSQITDRAPFNREKEVAPPISVGIGPERPGYHARGFPHCKLFFARQSEATSRVDQKTTRRSEWPLPGNNTPANKEVEIPVPVNISSGHGSRTRTVPGQDSLACRREIPTAIVEIQAVTIALVPGFLFNPPACHIEIEVPVAVRIEEKSSHVLGPGIGYKGRRLAPGVTRARAGGGNCASDSGCANRRGSQPRGAIA